MKRTNLTLAVERTPTPVTPTYPWLPKCTEVLCRLKNTGPTPLTVETMSCSWYDSWNTDSKKASLPSWPCNKNIPVKIVLKPGEVYEKVVPLQVRGLSRGEKHHVRLAFVHGKERIVAEPVLLELH